ncbi:cupin domain-containing protein [Clostridium aestuarii]|uniref:Cupin domain-containing protein n=1 Tax=Clostridium aestuarii TaxID=338193 RepID=A0ABT4CVH3_9CLOT|nr:cupin domain-containing protein [Clostridium aestuarii]MCY6482981.1 cupin domain-containing protein [Clostridium aestuarii]
MYNFYTTYPYPYYVNIPICNPYNMCYACGMYPYSYWFNASMHMHNPDFCKHSIKLKDYGPEPFVFNIEEATKQNNTFRTALWTGDNLQLTLMSIDVGDDIGLEVHPEGDQFIRIEEGQGLVKMGDSKDKLNFQAKVYDDYAIMIPAGKWHNVINTGDKPLKLYALYAPPEHPRDTVHKTKADAEAAEENYGY